MAASDDDRSFGQELAGRFWREHVGPALLHIGLDGCGAALLGAGSEVLGFDDERSRDHDFGPRLQVFVPTDAAVDRTDVEARLDAVLPDTFDGLPVRFPLTRDPSIRHRVTVTTLDELFASVLGVASWSEMSADAWLGIPTQALASVTRGAVFADPSGELGRARAALTWYPDDAWRYVLGCQWHRLAQLEPFLGRTAEVGDGLGSRLVAARLATDLIRLAFLVERTWAPYAKWLGSAFARLDIASELSPRLDVLVSTSADSERQDAYVAAAACLAELFNSLGLTEPIDPSPRPFHDRPFPVLDADRFAHACHAGLGLAALGWRGAVDQWIDSTDVLTDPSSTASLSRRSTDGGER